VRRCSPLSATPGNMSRLTRPHRFHVERAAFEMLGGERRATPSASPTAQDQERVESGDPDPPQRRAMATNGSCVAGDRVEPGALGFGDHLEQERAVQRPDRVPADVSRGTAGSLVAGRPGCSSLRWEAGYRSAGRGRGGGLKTPGLAKRRDSVPGAVSGGGVRDADGLAGLARKLPRNGLRARKGQPPWAGRSNTGPRPLRNPEGAPPVLAADWTVCRAGTAERTAPRAVATGPGGALAWTWTGQCRDGWRIHAAPGAHRVEAQLQRADGRFARLRGCRRAAV
jgi:hypothetical protein